MNVLLWETNRNEVENNCPGGNFSENVVTGRVSNKWEMKCGPPSGLVYLQNLDEYNFIVTNSVFIALILYTDIIIRYYEIKRVKC